MCRFACTFNKTKLNCNHAIFFQNTKEMFFILLRLLSAYVYTAGFSHKYRSIVVKSYHVHSSHLEHVLWSLFVSFNAYIGHTNQAIIQLAIVSCFFELCMNISKHPIEIKQGLIPGTYIFSGDNVKIDGDSMPIHGKL